MRISRKVALALAVAGVAQGTFGPALGQDRPESILPPGFGDPTPAPTPTPRATPTGPVPTVQPLPPDGSAPTPSPTPSETPTPVEIDPATLAFYELPPSARHSLDAVGPVRSADGGLPADAFGQADGRYLEGLMRRLSAPLPSRWLSILLRRLLVSELDTLGRTNGADFAAERAWLLLRMGESVSARAVVQGVDAADYTPKLYQVALDAMLATGDPGGMCTLADGGVRATGERGWVMARAMCAGLGGEPQRAAALVKDARRRRVARGIDFLLAQKVVGQGASGRQQVTIEWNGVDKLTDWRWGLATATGVAMPPELLAAAGPVLRLWQALAPGVSLSARVPAAEAAAAQGVLSSAALVDLYASFGGAEDGDAATAAAAQDLQTAYADRSADRRHAALGRLWGKDAAVPYARLVLTARAAARLPARAEQADADRLIASMLTAGLDRAAMRWRSVVPAGSDGWAMLTLADPDGRGTVGYGELTGYAGAGDARLKQQLLFAGLAGLGRLSPDDVERGARALEVRIGVADSWTRALDRAVADGQAGTAVLLCAVGMQANDWRGVPPAALYRIVAALRAVGLTGEARMIAAEALARV